MPRAMFSQMIKVFTAPKAEAEKSDDLHIAVGVLLVEAAGMDDSFDGKERGLILHFLSEKFALSEQERENILRESEAMAKRSAQLHPFTRTAFTRLERPQKIRLIEMLWEIAYSDGVITGDEDVLLRRVAGLIHLEDHERIDARRRVLARLGRA